MTFPHLVIIEALTALAVMALLLFLSAVRDAPLEEFANPDMSPNPAKAAWYLMGIQELILHMHPTWGAIILPGLVALALMVIPYLDRSQRDVGRWFAGRRGKRIALFTALGTLLIVPILVTLSSLVGVRSVWPGAPPPGGGNRHPVGDHTAAGAAWFHPAPHPILDARSDDRLLYRPGRESRRLDPDYDLLPGAGDAALLAVGHAGGALG